ARKDRRRESKAVRGVRHRRRRHLLAQTGTVAGSNREKTLGFENPHVRDRLRRAGRQWRQHGAPEPNGVRWPYREELRLRMCKSNRRLQPGRRERPPALLRRFGRRVAAERAWLDRRRRRVYAELRRSRTSVGRKRSATASSMSQRARCN